MRVQIIEVQIMEGLLGYKEKLQKPGGMTDLYLNWQAGISINWQL